MKIVQILDHGIIECTGEKKYKYRLTLDHWASKKRRGMNAYGNNWLCEELTDAIDLYNYEIELISKLKP